MRALLVFMCFKPVHNFGEWMLNILLVNIIVAIFRILDSGKLGRERNLYQEGECQSKKGWKRVESSCLAPYPLQACKGFEPMTSTILVQHSTNWANKPAGSWVVSLVFYLKLKRYDVIKGNNERCNLFLIALSNIYQHTSLLHLQEWLAETMKTNKLISAFKFSNSQVSQLPFHKPNQWCLCAFSCQSVA